MGREERAKPMSLIIFQVRIIATLKGKESEKELIQVTYENSFLLFALHLGQDRARTCVWGGCKRGEQKKCGQTPSSLEKTSLL